MAPATGSPTSTTEPVPATPAARRGLRSRLALALVGMAIMAATVLSLGNWAVERWVEDDSLDRLLEGELEHRVAAASAPTPDSAATTLRYYRPTLGPPQAPASLSPLGPGPYDRVLVDAHPYRVRVREVAPGDRAYLLFDLAPLEAREGRLIFAFAAGAALIALIAWRLSSRLAARALAPFDGLVKQLRGLDPEARGARLRLESGGAELDAIALAVNGYLGRLDTLVERERLFAAAASHELRTPLAVIGGATEVLAGAAGVPPQPLARIGRALAQARQDLEALLALSRLQPPPRERLALHERLPQWAALYQEAPGARLGQVRWSLSDVTLEGPPGSFAIVFTNLLRNALRAAGSSGVVEVDLQPGVLAVRDRGSGIPADELPQVFEPGFRGRDGGTGIGLYVARTLALREGWRLTLANREGGGAEAVLHF